MDKLLAVVTFLFAISVKAESLVIDDLFEQWPSNPDVTPKNSRMLLNISRDAITFQRHLNDEKVIDLSASGNALSSVDDVFIVSFPASEEGV